jgi:hypothetical protein
LTLPLPQPDESSRVNWLLRYITVQQLYDKKVVAALQRAAIDAEEAANKLTGDNIGDRTRRYQLKLVQNEIRLIIKDMFKDLVPNLNQGQQDAAEAAAKAAIAQDAKVLIALYPDASARKAFKASFLQTARHGISAMVTRMTKSELPLSKRVYRSSAFATGQLDKTINSHMARGSSARDLAKDVRKLIRPDTPGGVSYAAMRLARTEINNAFHAMTIQAAQKFPWVEEVEWHLSKTHSENPGDLCEVYAHQRYFPKDYVPMKPHPQCMCYVVPRTNSWGDFANQLESGMLDKAFEEKYGMPAA